MIPAIRPKFSDDRKENYPQPLTALPVAANSDFHKPGNRVSWVKRDPSRRPIAEATHLLWYKYGRIAFFPKAHPQKPPTQIGMLDAGIHGNVSKCIWQGQKIALKKLTDPQTAVREINAIKTLQRCPGAIQFLTSYRDKHHFCIGMNYFPITLDELDFNSISINKIITVVSNIAKELAYLESKNVKHNDVKPDNICLDEKEISHLIDFSFATDQRQINNSNGGTAEYAAPERLLNPKSKNNSSDLWSLGAVLYILCAKGSPFLRTMPVFLQNERRDIWRWYLAEIIHRIGLPPGINAHSHPLLKNNRFINRPANPDLEIGHCIRLANPEVPEALIHLVKQLLSYENRPSASEVVQTLTAISSSLPLAPDPKAQKPVSITRASSMNLSSKS